jgi:uncharacterized repeat protein (TIGR01451 family)
MRYAPWILLLLALVSAPVCADSGNARAHTILTDGVRATSNPDDAAWLTLYSDSTELPKTTFQPGEYCFWGVNGPQGVNPVKTPDLHQWLKQGNIKGVRYEIPWNGLQQYVTTNYNWGEVEQAVNSYAQDGFTVIGLLSYVPAWANGHRDRTAPPIQSVPGEVLNLSSGTATLAHAPVVHSPYLVPTNAVPVHVGEEILTTNYAAGQVPVTSKQPVIPSSVRVWVDENDGQGWREWQRVERLIESPDGATHFMADFRGRILFRNNNLFWLHGKTPANGSKVKVSYDAYDTKYELNTDYTYDHVTGTITAQLGLIEGSIGQETFSSTTLDPRWQWMDAPGSWDVNQSAPGHLRVDSSATLLTRGHFLHQTLTGQGDFTVQMRVTAMPAGHCGVMIYQDEQNWFRYCLTSDQGRPYLVQCRNGEITRIGMSGELGWMVLAPRWIVVRKQGSTYTCFTSNNSLTGPDGGYQWTHTFQQELSYPLKVGISISGNGSGHQVDEFRVVLPAISAHPEVRVFYDYLDTDPWANYVREVVSHFKDRIKHWELWNEPDQNWCWSGTQEQMAFMVRAGYLAAKQADPQAVVIGPGYANGANRHYSTIYNTIGSQFMDALAWHPYLFTNRPPDAVNWKVNPHLDGRSAMIANGDESKKVYFTEMSSTSGVTCWGGGNNDRKQAEYGLRLAMMARGLDYAGGMSWWPAMDEEPVGSREDHGFGGHDGLFYFHRAQIQSASRSNNIVTITTVDPHPYRPGDLVYFQAKTAFGVQAYEVLSVPSPQTFTFRHVGPDAATLWTEEKIINGIFPKPMYWAYRNAATNRGILVDLLSYDASDNPVPSSGKHSVKKVVVGVQDRSRVAQIRVLTSLTATDSTARPRRVAARHVGQAGVAPFVVKVADTSAQLKTERWTVTATGPSSFTVTGSVSGAQGTATPGAEFTSANGVVTFTIPSATYVAGDRFEFETFAGDGFTERAVWTNSGLSGPGDITINLAAPVDARYVAIHFVRAAGASSIKVDEIAVYNSSDANISQGKLYLVEGYQGGPTVPEDTEPPVTAISLSPDPGGGWSAQPVTVTLTATDNPGGSGVQAIYYSLNGFATSTLYTGPFNLGQGSHALQFRAVDARGNQEPVRSALIRVDTTPPSGTVAIQGGAAYTTSRNVTLALTASDNLSGVAQMAFSSNGNSWSAAESFASSKSWTLLAGDGPKTVYVRFRDAAGNWSPSVSATITLDQTPPGAPQGVTASVVGGAQVRLQWQAATDAVGVAGYQVFRGSQLLATTSGTSLTDADVRVGQTYTYTVRAFDHAGNTSDPSGPATVALAEEAPVLDLVLTGSIPDPRPGDRMTITVTYTNRGETVASSVAVSCRVPEHTSYVAGSASAGGEYDPENRILRWQVASVAPGASGAFTFDVIVD